MPPIYWYNEVNFEWGSNFECQPRAGAWTCAERTSGGGRKNISRGTQASQPSFRWAGGLSAVMHFCDSVPRPEVPQPGLCLLQWHLHQKKMHFLKVAAQEIIELVLHLDDKVIQAFKIWHWRQSVGRLSQAGVPPHAAPETRPSRKRTPRCSSFCHWHCSTHWR